MDSHPATITTYHELLEENLKLGLEIGALKRENDHFRAEARRALEVLNLLTWYDWKEDVIDSAREILSAALGEEAG